ncbi:polyhydroxyalkanoate synthase [Paracoccus aminovorans]|uniref:Polyhydroxyalkanoate synthase n=1 Tax=Paracoccus aminovorans TaxID=34004 RepID=A0A1I3BQ85_9RHOB|nr:class I poly(R)-hydroxyalkanoic acid synthase [Paracoccus aminovorans]SFH64069.1 polyhydroxyalkanoate synthase [Paracoccus aminovorans]
MAGKDEKPESGADAQVTARTGKSRAGTGKTRAAAKSAKADGPTTDSARAATSPAAGPAEKPAAREAEAAPEAEGAKTAAATGAKPAGGKAPATKTGTRNAAARARAAVRSDTRTGTRRKPVAKGAAKPAEAPTLGAVDDALRPLGATGPAAAVEAAPARAPAADAPAAEAPQASAPAAPALGSQTAAFVEAAFGPGSRLPEQLATNIERIESLTQRLISALSQRKPHSPGVEMPGPDLFATATSAWMKLLAEQPERVIGQQVSYWGETLRHFAEAQAALARGTLVPPSDEGPRDRRFSNPLWEAHPFFNFIKRQYQINAQALREAASALDLPGMTDRRRIEWFTRQMIDMMAPTNFLATNPDALEKALATEGESLVRGLENLVRDVEQNSGELIVSLADREAFRVGENIGTTQGTVVARTPLYELIQYKPTTESVHEIPLVIFPPWINKFYILDLKPQNSLIKWIVDQGYTLFVVAWKNPDPGYGDTGMENYVSAYLEVMDRVLDLTDQKKLNVVGYCIAGTTLALTLSLLKQRGDDRVNSATFFTTLTDFAEQGEFTAYLQDDFVSGIEEEASRTGVLSAQLMTRTFSFLRANDLVWGPAIRSYMLGETPPAFDLLFWNGDGTNLPGRMAVEYLRGLCQQNRFVREGFDLMGHRLHVSEVEVPLCAIACETDHIAPWRDSWRGVAQMGSADKRFILSESGHIAGIINPPSKKKYGHYTSDAGFEQGEQAWRDKAQYHEGSWWGRWRDWLARHAGGMVEARDPGEGFGPAPGVYVHERA